MEVNLEGLVYNENPYWPDNIQILIFREAGITRTISPRLFRCQLITWFEENVSTNLRNKSINILDVLKAEGVLSATLIMEDLNLINDGCIMFPQLLRIFEEIYNSQRPADTSVSESIAAIDKFCRGLLSREALLGYSLSEDLINTAKQLVAPATPEEGGWALYNCYEAGFYIINHIIIKSLSWRREFRHVIGYMRGCVNSFSWHNTRLLSFNAREASGLANDGMFMERLTGIVTEYIKASE
jgi:hypothetical protein